MTIILTVLLCVVFYRWGFAAGAKSSNESWKRYMRIKDHIHLGGIFQYDPNN